MFARTMDAEAPPQVMQMGLRLWGAMLSATSFLRSCGPGRLQIRWAEDELDGQGDQQAQRLGCGDHPPPKVLDQATWEDLQSPEESKNTKGSEGGGCAVDSEKHVLTLAVALQHA